MKKRYRLAAALLAGLLLLPVSVPAADTEENGSGDEAQVQYPVSDTLTPGGIVELEGGDLEEGAFTFVVMDEENNVLQTVTNSEEGGIDFEPITYTLNEPASESLTYTYTVRQLESDDPDVTIDPTVYTFAVVVTDPRDGTLEIWASEGWNSLDFTNTRKEKGKEETTPAADPEDETGKSENSNSKSSEDKSRGKSSSGKNSNSGSSKDQDTSKAKNTRTGDTENPVLWLLLAGGSLAVLCAAIVLKKKQK